MRQKQEVGHVISDNESDRATIEAMRIWMKEQKVINEKRDKKLDALCVDKKWVVVKAGAAGGGAVGGVAGGVSGIGAMKSGAIAGAPAGAVGVAVGAVVGGVVGAVAGAGLGAGIGYATSSRP